MKSNLCDRLGIEFPLFAFTHCRDVVAAVTNAGGFGVLGAVGHTPESLEIELNWIDDHVDGKSYGVDLLKGPREEGEPRTMLASYVELTQHVATMSEMDFFMRFGEVARIIRHLGGPADQNGRKVYELYRRHAETIGRVIDQGLAQCASQIRTRSLAEGCLL